MERVMKVLAATVLLVAMIAGTFKLIELSGKNSGSRVCRWLASIEELRFLPAFFGLAMWLTTFLDVVWKDTVTKFGRMPLHIFVGIMVFALVAFVGLSLEFVAYERFLEKGS